MAEEGLGSSAEGSLADGLDGTLLLRPVASGNTFEETVQRLLQTVRLGLIAPGERLPAERGLALRLGVSRDTLRDAISSLADSGYLVSRRGRYGGTFVSAVLPVAVPTSATTRAPQQTITAGEIEDVLVLREIIDVGAARAAAARALTPRERELLWNSLGDASDASPEEYRRFDSRLHLYIGELAGSTSLVPLLADIRMRINEMLDAIPSLGPNIAHSDEQHKQIVLAILTGRPEAAAQAMREHVAGTALLLRGFLQ